MGSDQVAASMVAFQLAKFTHTYLSTFCEKKDITDRLIACNVVFGSKMPCIDGLAHNYSNSIAKILGLYSLSGKTSYRKISWSLEAAGFGFKLFQSLWNLAGTSAALLPRCLSNFRAMRPLQHPISRLRDFARFGGKTSYRLVNRGPGITVVLH